MLESLDPIEYLGHLRDRWKFLAGTAITAAILTLIGCWLVPARYTATATLVIEPPAGSDPRAATAVSAVYLESLKTYEEFAASDTLFAKARDKFHFAGPGGPSLESFKRQTLRVTKPKDTKLLQINVTLPDPKQAQAMAEYLARETVELNRSLASSGDGDLRGQIDKEVERARAELDRARTVQAGAEAAGSAAALDDEVRALTELRARTTEQIVSANALLAELVARRANGADEEITATKARATALTSERAALEREASAKASTLAALRARQGRADDEVRAAQNNFETLSRRAADLATAGGTRSEQLHIIDPGTVPQQPSFPQPTLFSMAAAIIASVLALVFVTLQFGLARGRARSSPTEFKVARGR